MPRPYKKKSGTVREKKIQYDDFGQIIDNSMARFETCILLPTGEKLCKRKTQSKASFRPELRTCPECIRIYKTFLRPL